MEEDLQSVHRVSAVKLFGITSQTILLLALHLVFVEFLIDVQQLDERRPQRNRERNDRATVLPWNDEESGLADDSKLADLHTVELIRF